MKKLLAVIQRRPKYNKRIEISESINYHSLPEVYRDSDLFVYASTCETFGLTVLEAMAGGLPIACSNKSSMKEVLLDCGLYFDPLDAGSISDCMIKLFNSKELRRTLGVAAAQRAKKFTWKRSSDDTFNFLFEHKQSEQQAGL